MTDLRVSELNPLTGAAAANGDLILVVDVSDPAYAASGTDKNMTMSEFAVAMRTRITAGGDATGPLSALVLANSGVTAATKGSATRSAIVTVDAKGRVTSLTDTPISGGGGGTSFGVGSPGTQYVDYVFGSDANDGLSWTTARKTMDAALATIMAGPQYGDIFLAAGVHVRTTQFTLPAGGISVHGWYRPSLGSPPGGDFTGGTQILWNGPNSGAVFKTSQFDNGGIIENICIRFPAGVEAFAGYTNVRAFHLDNWQNKVSLKNCSTRNAPLESFYFLGTNSGVAGPGFVHIQECWAINTAGNGTRPFVFAGGLENVTILGGGTDTSLSVLADITIADTYTTAPGGTPTQTIFSGHQLSLTVIGFKSENGNEGTITPGGAGDHPFLEVLGASFPADRSPAITLIGCYSQSTAIGSPFAMTSACIRYTGQPTEFDDDWSGIPLVVLNFNGQAFGSRVQAANADGGAILATIETVPQVGGNMDRWSYVPNDRSGVAVKDIASGNFTANFPVTLARGAGTGTLPTAVGKRGQERTIVKAGTTNYTVTLATTGGQFIDNAAPGILTGAGVSRGHWVSDGANWWSI